MTQDAKWTPKAIKTLRKERLRWTQLRFSSELGTYPHIVSRWENGHTKPSRLNQKELDALEEAYL